MELNSKKQDEIIKKVENETVIMRNDCESVKPKVVDFIIEKIMDVDLTIPDVVKGHFSQKMGVSK